MTAFDEDIFGEIGGNGPRRARVFRDDPRRSRPIRNWWNFFRFADREQGAREQGNGQEQTLSDAVNRSVKLGYDVIEEQISQGQRAAAEINNRSYGTQSMNRDMQELMVRSMRYYVDTATIFMDSVAAATRPIRGSRTQPPGSDRGAGADQRTDPPGTTAPDSAAEAAVPIRVSSVRPATVTLDLRPGVAGRSLAVPGLYAAGADKTPITRVVFEDSEDPPVLSVDVPPDQPAGLYSGVVFDTESEEPRGTLTIRID